MQAGMCYHLGSAAWITAFDGQPIQYIHYLPYGQLLADQRIALYDERFKFIGKERDEESGYDYFGARYYIPPFLHFASVEPLLDKYLHISPYSYAAWNPIKYVDRDGEKCTLSINHQTNTITVSARYYALRTDSHYAQKAVNFWNNQKGLSYTAKDGTNYSVQFALKVYSSANPNIDASFAEDGNTFKIVKTLGHNEDGHLITGHVPVLTNRDISVIDSHKETLTGAHEVGHTLMNIPKKDAEHSVTGVMTKTNIPNVRSASVSQETVNSIIESNGFNQKDQTVWQKIKSWFE